MQGFIKIRGAREHNLREIDVDIPLGSLTVVTGPSGSGKTSLAMHTLYAEGQRRYMETFSPYVRQFMDRMDRPDLDSIENILPAIALEQRNTIRTSRSTVGTMTGLNDYWKLIYAQMSVGHDAEGNEVHPMRPALIVEELKQSNDLGADFLIAFEVKEIEGMSLEDLRGYLSAQGYVRLWMAGGLLRLDEWDGVWAATGVPEIDAVKSILVVQDRVKLVEDPQRMMDSLESAMRLGSNCVWLFKQGQDGKGWEFCRSYRGDWYPLVEPRAGLFSSNSPLGACPECKGYGRTIHIDYLKAINPELSLNDGLITVLEGKKIVEETRRMMLDRAKKTKALRMDIPWKKLSPAEQEWVLKGEELDEKLSWDSSKWFGIEGFFRLLEKESHSMITRVFLSKYRVYNTCFRCHGKRLREEALAFTIGGKSLPDLQEMPMSDLRVWLDEYVVSQKPETRGLRHAIQELRGRVEYLNEVGLGYLTSSRLTRSLSGGEIERVSLTSCLGAALTDTLFVLDEPTVGLHPRDTEQLIHSLKRLQDRGNTLVIVEHEEAVMRAADYLIDMGPSSGAAGGNVVYAGSPEGILTKEDSCTGRFLAKTQEIALPKQRKKPKQWLKIRGATQHNLKGLDVDIPLGVFTCLTGVSGSGKSSLAQNIIVANANEDSDAERGVVKSMKGLEYVDEVVMVDQSPLVRTPRSTPSVYIGAFEDLRKFFAELLVSKSRALTPGYFSFNSPQGRCPRCTGRGFELVEMQFLSDVFIKCALCEGSRYSADVLEIQWNGLSIADILQMSVAETHALFSAESSASARRVVKKLEVLLKVGLGHLGFGQGLNTLSGGENQRLKLAKILVEHTGKTEQKGKLLILDEPGTGLHFSDIEVLLRVFDELVLAGHSLLVIEHNMDFIKSADYLIDLGPEGGLEGGQLVASGSPEKVATEAKGYTAQFLRAALGMDALEAAPIDVPAALVDEIPQGVIALRGARHHQLKNIDVDIKRGDITVVTGLSGSGKSTLAFDIIFAEGQRRFLEVMSPYARQFTEQFETPDIDRLTGLPPTVAIEQNRSRGGMKSTVGTVTEIWQFVRLLYAKLGQAHCPTCKIPVGERRVDEVIEMVHQRLRKLKSIEILAPVVIGRKGHYADLASWARGKGYQAFWVDGARRLLEGFEPLDRYSQHDVDIIISVLDKTSSAEDVARVVKLALEMGSGFLKVLVSNDSAPELVGTKLACPSCHESFARLEPSTFSFNSPRGWCPKCRGHGRVSTLKFDADSGESLLDAELRYDRKFEKSDGEDVKLRICPDCQGMRLSPWALAVTLQGWSIGVLGKLDAHAARKVMSQWVFNERDGQIAHNVVSEIGQRLDFLERVGLGYLAMDRGATTLSGGETQRIRLASQLGSALRGVLYVLDEPTIGLHPKDNDRLLGSLKQLKTAGNTLLIVEHDEDTMKIADHIIDLGPGAGIHGGEVVASGSFEEVSQHKESMTGLALRSKKHHPYAGSRRKIPAKTKTAEWLMVNQCTLHNLKKVDFKIPRARLTVLTGVSGAGKTSLMTGCLGPAVRQSLGQKLRSDEQKAWSSTSGLESIRALYQVDQSPIGKTPRSTPATYIGIFTEIRQLFAMTPNARRMGFDAGRFSFNTARGHCESCKGTGWEKQEMDFLPPSYHLCETCMGARYNAATLTVQYKGKNIAEVLNMSMEEATEFFAGQARLADPLRMLCDTGLGYLTLGQASNTLSGGEAQRIKLVAELIKGRRAALNAIKSGKPLPQDLYLIEEPSIGLHPLDVSLLIEVLHRLVDLGNTVVLVEHNLDIIAEAHYILDIGPGPGADGGTIVATGSPEAVLKSPKSSLHGYSLN